MKLRVRINHQTSRVELVGEEPRLQDVMDEIRETVLPSHGFSAETEFSLSLNGSELLSDAAQTLASCGIVAGDLICVILPQSAAAASTTSTKATTNPTNMPTGSPEREQQTSNQPSSSSVETPDTLDPEPSVSVWEPMLCCEAGEGQAPLSLELLYHSAQTRTPSDAVMVAVNLLLLETGFVPQGCELKPTEMPAGWRSVGGVYKLQYSHPLCGDSVAVVVGVCMGPVFVVNAILKVNQTVITVHKLCLIPSSYVTNQWPGESAAAAFKDLNKLSRVFKDQLAYPLIAAARDAMALPVAFGLAALPPELLLRILRLLDVCSVVRLSSVCRHLDSATADSTLWRHLFRRDFTDPDPSRPRDTDWKEVYKRFHKTRVSLRCPRYRSLPHFYPTPRDIFNPAPLYPVPGIIGGEYDQRPNLPHSLLPRPRYDPIGPLHDRDRVRPTGGRPADVRPADLRPADVRPADVRLRPADVRLRPADVRRGFI